MLARHLAPHLLDAATQNPVVTLTGPRQSGKTTLVRALFPDHEYVSLELPDVRSRAVADPRGFLAEFDTVILDEVQRAPDLLSYIQVLVDESNRPGRFILTGSQNLLLMRSVSQSLAGRTALLHLYPLSLTELLGSAAFDPSNLAVASTQRPKDGRWKTLHTGFYPRIHDHDLSPREWLADYFRTYVDRDLAELMHVANRHAFEDFVRLAAASTAQELNLNRMANDVGITQQTARRWLDALETGFLAVTLPAHHANFRKRLRKRPKLHFLDTGLICYLLDITDAHMLARHPLRGAIFESFVVSELVKSFAHRRQGLPLFHWRDATGHEIDILVESAGRLIPMEVKSGETVAADAFDTLVWWRALPDNTSDKALLIHGGNDRYRSREVDVLPWFAV